MSETMVKCAARALVKLSQENTDLRQKVAQLEAKERALAVAFRLAESGAIEHGQIMEKAAALAKEDLNIIEKAMDLNIGNILTIGSAAMEKEASEKKASNAEAKKSFEEFLVNTYS